MTLLSKISVIIPIFNRPNILKKTIRVLVTSTISNEILICDGGSNSITKVKIKKIISEFNFHQIRYLDIGVNSHSKKRNVGIKKAKSKYIIFLDDDCIPEKKFLENYYFLFEKFKNKKYVLCGSVIYPNPYKNKFVTFRQSRHFVQKNINDIKFFLSAKNITTMNMGLKKNLIYSKKILFNENFNKYGFEDYEFGFRLVKNKIKILGCSPKILHIDNRSLKQYLNKIKFVGLEGGKFLTKINKEASLDNNFIKIQNNYLINKFYRFKVFLKILIFLEKIFLKFESKIQFPNIFYRFIIVNSYLVGYMISKDEKISDDLLFGWYK